MAWTATTFKAALPEFEPISDARVTTALTDAAAQVDSRVFGDLTDRAVSLLAAHQLAVGPSGQAARLDAKGGDGTTVYLSEWKRLARTKAGGPWALGRGPSGSAL